MNKVCLTGRITHDIELKATANGVNVTRFSIAVKRPHTKDVTDFFRVVCWRSSAEFVSKYFKKGDAIEVVGTLTQRKYEKDGNSIEFIEVQADEVSFPLTTKNDGTKPQEASYGNTDGYEELEDDDELPF